MSEGAVLRSQLPLDLAVLRREDALVKNVPMTLGLAGLLLSFLGGVAYWAGISVADDGGDYFVGKFLEASGPMITAIGITLAIVGVVGAVVDRGRVHS